jgi:F-type H+-transporting ATPase subunit b
MQRRYIYIALFLVTGLILPFVQFPKPIKDILYKAYNLLLFVYIIYILVAPKMKAFFIQRKEHIEKEIAEAHHEKDKAEKILMMQQEQVESLEDKKGEILEKFRSEGNREKERIIQEAQEEAQSIINQARTTIQQEVRTYREELKREAVTHSLQAAAELIGKNYNQEDQKKTIDEILTKVKDIRQ